MNNIVTYVGRGVSDRFCIQISMSDNKCEDQTKSRKNAFSINLSVVITKKNINVSKYFLAVNWEMVFFLHHITRCFFLSYTINELHLVTLVLNNHLLVSVNIVGFVNKLSFDLE